VRRGSGRGRRVLLISGSGVVEDAVQVVKMALNVNFAGHLARGENAVRGGDLAGRGDNGRGGGEEGTVERVVRVVGGSGALRCKALVDGSVHHAAPLGESGIVEWRQAGGARDAKRAQVLVGDWGEILGGRS